MGGVGAHQESEASLQLPADPSSAAAARSFVKSVLESSGHSSVEDAALLCVTELVANVSRHTTSRACTVSVTSDDDQVLIEVADDDPTPPMLGPTSAFSETGRGLRIVSALAREWGVRRLRSGKAVWLKLCNRPT